MLVYADSSDEEEMQEDFISQRGIAFDQDDQFHKAASQYGASKRHDSLREIVYLKDTKAGSHSFNEKQLKKVNKGKVAIPTNKLSELSSKH